MQILSVPYAMLLFATAGLCQLLPRSARPALLALASLLFYASASLSHALLICALLVVVWAGGELLSTPRSLSDRRRRCLAAVGIVLCAGVLAYFKYAAFFHESLTAAANGLAAWLPRGFPAPPAARSTADALPMAVPLGISFFTFEFIHYLVDAYRGQLITRPESGVASLQSPPSRLLGLLHFAAFSLFFPTLLAGPIKRYQQFQAAHTLQRDDIAYGLGRIAIGLAKKVLIADSVAGVAMRLSIPDQVTTLGLWAAMYAYAVQIYFDFSGYSDLAIGAARLLGYRVPENFDWPYLATDLSLFWRRWHISLSSWIRDYLYIPLGGNRRGAARTLFNLLVVMSICGLWHGPAWHFVAWGAWHGAGLVVTQRWSRRNSAGLQARAQEPRPLRWRVLTGLATFHFVCFGWVLFAAPSLSVALTAFARMLGWTAGR